MNYRPSIVAVRDAANAAHRALTEAAEVATHDQRLDLLIAAAKRALAHYERISSAVEDSAVMWDLRRGIREIQRERGRSEPWP